MKGPSTNLETRADVGFSMFQTAHLPAKVSEVPREVVRAFSHTKRVGSYLLGRTLGAGSFAKVKEALHLPTGEKVAIKIIDKKRAKADPYVRKNLRREGRLLQQVCHPNVVQLLEILETEHSYYLVTECCSGGDLMELIAKRKRLEECDVKKFIRQIVSAVDYFHRLGIIHRDLKIENLLLDENQDIKIIDFGLSNNIKVSNAVEGIARAQELLVTQCGSPAYAAPELLHHRKYGLQVDVWSIGVNMYAMLTGNLPFTVDPFNIKTLYNKMISGQMNPIPDNLSQDGKDMLMKFLTPDPDKRITLEEAFRHPWLSQGRNKPMERHPFPNKLKSSELQIDILKHMSDNLGFRMSEIIRFVTGNVPSSACATYHMYFRKLKCHRSAQSTVPARDTGSMAGPNKITLDLQDMTHRLCNVTVPAKPVCENGDSNKEIRSRDTSQFKPHEKLESSLAQVKTKKESTIWTQKSSCSAQDNFQETEGEREELPIAKTPSTIDAFRSLTHRTPKLISPAKAAQKAAISTQTGITQTYKQEPVDRYNRVTPGATPRTATYPISTFRHVKSDTIKVKAMNLLDKTANSSKGTVSEEKAFQTLPLSPKDLTGNGVSVVLGNGVRPARAACPTVRPTIKIPTDSASVTSTNSQAPSSHQFSERRVSGQWRQGEIKTRREKDEPSCGQKDVSRTDHSISPPVVPRVRRRLARRLLQDGIHHSPKPFSPDDAVHSSPWSSMTVERLGSPFSSHSQTKMGMGASLRDSLLPAISPKPSPRR